MPISKAGPFSMSPRVDFVSWVITELYLEVALVAKGGVDTNRRIDASALNEAERLDRIKILATHAIDLMDQAKQGRYESPKAGRLALKDQLVLLGQRYAAMIDELPRFEANVDEEN